MCENNQEKNFITEKIWEPIISETLVFYWGCPNIAEYINPMAFVQLPIDDFEKSFQIIKESINNNLWEQRLPYIKEEKEKILDYYNFFPTLKRIIENDLNLTTNISKETLQFNKIIYNLKLHNLKQNNLNRDNICIIHSCNLFDRNTNPNLNILLEKIIKHNFHNYLTYIIINNTGYKIDLDIYLSKYPELNEKIKIVNYFNQTNLFEIPTIKLMWYFSNIYSNTNIIYLHTKGVSYELDQNLNNIIISRINDWVQFMLYNLLSSNLSIKLLDKFDSVGSNYIEKDYYGNKKPHWSGNFWAATSTYIKSLDISNLSNKHDAEWFILSKDNCNYFELANSNTNHYEKNYPLEIFMSNNKNLKNKNHKILLNLIKKGYNYSSAWKGHLEFSMWLVNILNPKVVVELGVDYAHSTFCLSSELDKNSVIYGIDSFEGDSQSGFRNTFEIVENMHLFLLDTKLLPNNNIKFIKGYFNDVNKNFNEQIDLLHIDGLHDYDSVKNDFNLWFPKLSTNGVVIFHDTISFPNDVGKFFNELDYPKTNFIHSAGLGIISRNINIIEFIKKNWTNKINYKLVNNLDYLLELLYDTEFNYEM
jgi:hypothetical protein